MKKSYGLLLLALPALLLSACGNDTVAPSEDSSSKDDTSIVTPVGEHTVTFHLYDNKTEVVTVKDGEKVKKPEDPVREGYLFAGWFTTNDGTEEFYFGTKITADTDIYAHWGENKPVTADTLKAAFEADYSNCEVTYESSNEMEAEFIVHNFNGYSIAESLPPTPGADDYRYIYYHDYEGESYNWWFDKSNPDRGGAWIRQGKKIDENSYINLGMDFIYFNPRIHLGALDVNDFNYSNGAFHCKDQEAIAAALKRGAFGYIWENPIYEISITLTPDQSHVEQIITFDDDNPKATNKTVTSIFNLGQVDWTLTQLPPEPIQSNVKTWYEWTGEDEPTFNNNITKIELGLTSPSNELLVGEELKMHYDLTPIKPDKKDIEFKFDGPAEGLEINYDFGDNNIIVKANQVGTYQVYVHDVITNTDSNKVEVKVLDTKPSKFTNILYDLELDFDTNQNPSLYNYENENVATFEGSAQCFEARNGFGGSDNPKFGKTAMAMAFYLGTSDSLNIEGDESYVIFELDQNVNAMSFTYGALFLGHEQAAKETYKRFDAHIYTSDDGTNFDLVEDWTEDCRANITSETTRRHDVDLGKDTKFVKIGFDSLSIGKSITICMDSWAFYNETK